MRLRSLLTSAVFAVCFLGCGGKGGGGGGAGSYSVADNDGGANTVTRGCVDMDGDGYGKNCPMGQDCNDNDPNITDECIRCRTTNQGCPCDPGTMPMRCDPHYMQKTTMNGVSGTLVCSEGTRYCRDGVYSDCEVLFQYAMFVADSGH